MVKNDQQCDRAGVIYMIQCMKCLEDKPSEEAMRYIGMTRTTVHNRMVYHLRDRDSKLSSSSLYRHDQDVHGGEKQTYRTEIIGSEKKIVRLNCLEGINIEKQPSNLLMNGRNERGRGGIVRITATRVSN